MGDKEKEKKKKVHIKGKDKKKYDAEIVDDHKNEIVMAKTILHSEKLVMTRSEFINSLLDGIEEIEIPESRKTDFIRDLTTQAMQKVKLVKDAEVDFVGDPTVKVYIIVLKEDYDKHKKKKDNPAFWREILAQEFDAERRYNNDKSKAVFEIRLSPVVEGEGDDAQSELDEMVSYLDSHKKEKDVMVNSYQLGGVDAFRDYLNNTAEWQAKDEEQKGTTKKAKTKRKK